MRIEGRRVERGRFRRVTMTGLLAGAIVTLVAGPAAAHVEPEPTRVKPGKAATVEFTPEHGCEESPTTKMTFQVPKGAKGAKPLPLDGWTTSATGRQIVFEGGPLPTPTPADADGFSISFTAPDKKTILAWKVVQTCQEGEVSWIETGKDSTDPAPLVGVGKLPPAEEEDEPGA